MNDPVALPMAATGLELIASWGVPAIAARLAGLTDQLADGVAALGFDVPAAAQRSPHILGARLPGGLPEGLIGRLRERQVFVSDRLGTLRLSPHIFANEADVERCLSALRESL